MITEQDLKAAIAECEGERNPNANTCVKLAAFYIIREHLFGSADDPSVSGGYSFSAEPAVSPQADIIYYDSGTEFSRLIDGRYTEDILPIMDDLMTTLQVVNPRLYASVVRKFEEGIV